MARLDGFAVGTAAFASVASLASFLAHLGPITQAVIAISTLVTAIVQRRNRRDIQSVKVSVNGHLDNMIRLEREEAFRQGIEAGKKQSVMQAEVLKQVPTEGSQP